jgi:hypothetical protein
MSYILWLKNHTNLWKVKKLLLLLACPSQRFRIARELDPLVDDKASRSHKSSAKDTTDPDPQGATLRGSDNLAPAVSALPMFDDASDTSSRATVAPSICADDVSKQGNPLDTEGSTGNQKEEKPAPFEGSRDSVLMELPAPPESRDPVVPLEESRDSETTEKPATHENKNSDASHSFLDEVVN